MIKIKRLLQVLNTKYPPGVNKRHNITLDENDNINITIWAVNRGNKPQWYTFVLDYPLWRMMFLPNFYLLFVIAKRLDEHIDGGRNI